MIKHLVWLSLLAIGCASAGELVDMKMVSSGAMKQLYGYIPSRLDLSTTRPASGRNLPAGVQSPLFGLLPFRLDNGVNEVAIVLDLRKKALPGLYVDANGNGDLTDDPLVQWKSSSATVYEAEISLRIGNNQRSSPVAIHFYRFHDDPNTKQYENSIGYYRDYAPMGKVTLGGKDYKAALDDARCTGDFRGGHTTGADSGVWLLLDTNNSGRLTRQSGKNFDVCKPFNVGGANYELRDMTPDGHFSVVHSGHQVSEIVPPPVLEIGHVAPSFTATTMDGKAVHFPLDYKGHLVMIDFWATWCGPCMGEVPGLVAAYEKLHHAGFEVLGISLDQPAATTKIKAVARENKMEWPEIYDGKAWHGALVEQYGIDGIPTSILVDGDTGKILATKNGLRGDALQATVQKAIAARGK